MLVSSTFKNEEIIPTQYTCEGRDVSPPLKWERISGAITYAIIMEDPDAPGGTFIHWVIYNLKTNELPEGIEKKERTQYGLQGVNDFGKTGYNGPCPPKGHGYHRYYYNVYALNTELSLRALKKKSLQTI